MHFYLDDYVFDNSRSLWHAVSKDSLKVQTFLKRIRQYSGLIAPDYSVYCNMPLIMQVWNIYRSRAVYSWLRRNGINVIPNISWGDQRTYKYAFKGVEKNGIVSVGSHGVVKLKEFYHIFMNGFSEMVKTVSPKIIIIYGPVTSEMEEICNENNIEIINFRSDIYNHKKGDKYGKRKD